MPDLQAPARGGDGLLQRLHLFDAKAERLLAEHMLAGFQRGGRRRHVERVRGRDDDRVQRGIGEHRVVVAEGLLRCVGCGHARQEVRCHVADGVEVGVAALGGALEMRGLGDRATAQDANLQSLA